MPRSKNRPPMDTEARRALERLVREGQSWVVERLVELEISEDNESERARAGAKRSAQVRIGKLEPKRARLRAEYARMKKKNPRLSEVKIAGLLGVTLKVLRLALGKKV